MHEYGLVQELLSQAERVARDHGSARVLGLQVAIGDGAGVDAVLLRLAYETFREPTCCAGAPLTLRTVPERWACPSCDQPLAPGARLQCADCGTPARMVSGSELVLERVDLEACPPDTDDEHSRPPGGPHV